MTCAPLLPRFATMWKRARFSTSLTRKCRKSSPPPATRRTPLRPNSRTTRNCFGTGSLLRNITEAAQGSTEITQNIVGVSQAAQGTSSSAHESMTAAQQLAQMVTQLRGLVEQFKVSGEKHGSGQVRKLVN
jgi:hypothetical protein